MATQSGLILIDSGNSESDPKFNNNTNQGGDYVAARVQGTYSFYVVYSEENYEGRSCIIKSECRVDPGFTIRSYQGRDKQGIVLFTDYNFCGQLGQFTTEDTDITDQFPAGKKDGASSAIAWTGKWRLYKQQNFQGGHIQDLEAVIECDRLKNNDKCKSLKLL